MHFFAYYSFQKLGEFFGNVRGAEDSEIDKMDVVMEPYSIQAISILRMLGCHAVGTVVVSDTDARIGDGMKVAGIYQQVAEHVFQHREHLYDTRSQFHVNFLRCENMQGSLFSERREYDEETVAPDRRWRRQVNHSRSLCNNSCACGLPCSVCVLLQFSVLA